MTAGATVTLKPCPFCGGEAHPPKPMGGHPSAIRLVQCSRSEYCGSVVGGTDAEAITAWNTRATAAEFAAREAALVEAIVRDLALTKLANFEHASAEWLDGFGFAMERVIARAHTTSEGEG